MQVRGVLRSFFKLIFIQLEYFLKMGRFDAVVHNIRFYNLETRAIHCMSLERCRNKLALTRADNSIEIWDVRFTPHLQMVIFNDSTNSVEDIKWFDDRLFTCGLEGYIVEYDCLSESVKQSVPVTGGPAWCVDVNQKRKLLACGTEDGYINILDLGNDGIEHLKFLDKQQGRILCLCWDKSGQHLVTGSVDVIRVWNVDTGHAIHKMKTGRSQNNTETVVWCVAVTSDFTIISGDSRGFLCFWDGKIGTQIESNSSHGADILSIALTEDESTVYCAGVDPLITMYGKVAEYSGGRRKWAKGGQRKIHDHDVRALAVTKDNKLFSGSIDGYLALSYFPPKVLVKFPPLLKSPFVSLVPSKRYLLLRYLTHLELWKLGQPEPNQENCDSLLRLHEKETQLLQLKPRKDDVIVSAAISPDGQYIAYSTEKTIEFFKFSCDITVSLAKLPHPSDCGSCRLIQFYRVAKRHFCATVSKRNEINILEVEESGPDVIHTIRPDENQILTDTISHLVISSDGSYLIAADCQSNIAVWSRSNWTLHCSLPKYDASITALAVRDGTNYVVVAYSDFKVVEFDLKEQQYTKFSKNLRDGFARRLQTPIGSIVFDGRRNHNIIVHDDSSICVLYKNEDSWETPTENKKLIKTSEDDMVQEKHCDTTRSSFNVIKKSKHVAAVGWLSDEEMVVVSVCPLKLLDNLPPTLARKLFST